MGNAIEVIKSEMGGSLQIEEQAKDMQEFTVIDLDSENWREKVQEYKMNCYIRNASPSANAEGADGEKVRSLSHKERRDSERLQVQLTPKVLGNTDTYSASERVTYEVQVKLQEEQEKKILQQQQRLAAERSAKSRERIEGIRIKYKLRARDYNKRCTTTDFVDKEKENEDRERSSKLRRYIRGKYQLPATSIRS